MTFVPLLILAVSPILIDGSFEDWGKGETETADEYYFYKRITLQDKACLQQLPKERSIQLGGYEILFSPEEKGYGVSCFFDGKEKSPYEIGVVFAPTTAATEFEIRIKKAHEPPRTPYSLAPRSEDTVRVVCWNVQFGQLLVQEDRGSRILKALQPDILLLQELDGNDTPEKLRRFLANALGGTWNVHMSAGTVDEQCHRLRSAVATRIPSIKLRNEKATPKKTVMAKMEVHGKLITLVSLHFRCCGGPDGEAEHQRREEATQIRNAIDGVASQGAIIAGDWNLVGTNQPLLEVKGDDFTVVEALQPDGLLCATWSDTTSVFTPGRLDWMLVSTDSIEVDRGFVLDTSDLDSETLESHHLFSQDTAKLSDHLPLVADLRILH